MNKSLLLGLGRFLLPIPPQIWRRQVGGSPGHTDEVFRFMSADHHRVRNFAVREIARTGAPLPPAFIAEQLQLPAERVVTILEQLEHHMTFLYRDSQGAVVWAYPVTAAPTPHRVTFSTGERTHAA